MVCKITFTRQTAQSRSGFVLAETLVTIGVTAMLFIAIAAVAIFSGQSFAALGNYVDLDDKNRVAIDILTRDLRQCNRVIGSTSTSLTVEDEDLSLIAYNYSPDARTLTRVSKGDSQVLLRECDKLNFSLGQRTPVGGSYQVYPAATPATAKVVNVVWSCSRTIMGVAQNTESVQTARIVIRKQDS